VSHSRVVLGVGPRSQPAFCSLWEAAEGPAGDWPDVFDPRVGFGRGKGLSLIKACGHFCVLPWKLLALLWSKLFK